MIPVRLFTSGLITLLLALPTWLLAGDFNPNNPPEPYPTYPVVVSVSDPDAGTVSGGGSYQNGASVTLRAYANYDYYFMHWTLNGEICSTSSIYTIQVQDTISMQYVAVFGSLYRVSVVASPNGTGYGYPSSASYPSGQSVQVSAYPYSGYHFDGWLINGYPYAETEASFTYIVGDTAAVFTALFQANAPTPDPPFNPNNPNEPLLDTTTFTSRVQLVALPEGSCTFNYSNNGIYVENSILHIQCTPRTNYQFVGWYIDDMLVDTMQSFYLTVPKSDVTYTARLIYQDPNTDQQGSTDPIIPDFDPNNPPNPNGGGDSTNVDTTTTYAYYAPDSVGYHFIGWSDGEINNPRSIVANAPIDFEPLYAPNMYYVSAKYTNAAEILGAGQKYAYGTMVSLTIVPLPHYHLLSWSTGDTVSTIQFTILSDTTFAATCIANTYTVNLQTDSMGTVSGSGEYTYHTTILITANPLPGYQFDSWSDGNTESIRAITVDDNIGLTAYFRPSDPTGINTPNALPQCSKILHNHRIWIIRDGKKFTTQGQVSNE